MVIFGAVSGGSTLMDDELSQPAWRYSINNDDDHHNGEAVPDEIEILKAACFKLAILAVVVSLHCIKRLESPASGVPVITSARGAEEAFCFPACLLSSLAS
jgi:hypothetical protein